MIDFKQRAIESKIFKHLKRHFPSASFERNREDENWIELKCDDLDLYMSPVFQKKWAFIRKVHGHRSKKTLIMVYLK